MWISMIFGCQSSILHTSVDIHSDIQAGISMQGNSTMDVRQTWISTNGYPYVFMDISLQLSMSLLISIRISIDFYGYPCMDLLWILYPGSAWRVKGCWSPLDICLPASQIPIFEIHVEQQKIIKTKLRVMSDSMRLPSRPRQQLARA